MNRIKQSAGTMKKFVSNHKIAVTAVVVATVATVGTIIAMQHSGIELDSFNEFFDTPEATA